MVSGVQEEGEKNEEGAMETYRMGKTGNLVGPQRMVSKGLVWTAVQQEVLEEAHVLQAEEWDLVLRLVVDERRHRVLTLQARLEAVTAGWPCLLAFDAAALAVEAAAPRLGVAAAFEALVVAAVAGGFVAAQVALHMVVVLLLPVLLMVVGVVVACQHECRRLGCHCGR